MKRRGRLLSLILVVTVVISLSFAACGKSGSDSKGSDGKETYKIGCLTTLSGDNGFLGGMVKEAVDLEVAKINADGGVDGHPIEIVYQDDAFEVAKGVSGFDKLAQQDKVSAVMGLLGEVLLTAVQPSAEKYEIPLILNVPSVPDSREIAHKWVFSAAQNEIQDVAMWVQWCKDNNFTKVAFLQTNDALNDARLGEAKKEFPANGIELNVLPDQVDFTTADPSPEVTKLKALVEKTGSQAVVITTWPNNIPNVLSAAKSIGLDVPFTQYCEGGDVSLLSMAKGNELEGMMQMGFKILAKDALPDEDPQKEVVLEFTKRFEAEYGRIAGVEDSWARDSLHIIVNALKEAGSGDPSKVRDAIENNTKGLIGTSGVYTYTPESHDGLGIDSMGWYVIEDGKFVMYKDNIMVDGELKTIDLN
jgi:branched-chain amino acid transport system substrate-binding protein